MCSKRICGKCGKASWSGCGQHVEEVLRGIPQADRCPGHQNEPKEPGLFSRLFKKR